MNPQLDLSLLDDIDDQDASLIPSGTDATDPFTDNFPSDTLDLELWPVNLDLDAATYSAVTEITDESASVHNDSIPADHTRLTKPELEFFPFEADVPPAFALSAALTDSRSTPLHPLSNLQENEFSRSNVGAASPMKRPAVKSRPVVASVPQPSPQPSPSIPVQKARQTAVTVMSADASRFTPKAEVSTVSSGDSASTSSRAGPSSPSERAKEKLAQRKLRNKESARRYREKQVARRRQLEAFTRSLSEQNRELEALHDRLLALTCDRRNVAATSYTQQAQPVPQLAHMQ